MINWLSKSITHESENVLNAFKMGLLGMIIGVGYSYGTSKAKEHNLLVEMDPPVEAFNQDDLAPIIFYKLSKFRSLDEDAYFKAVLWTDQIFLIEQRLHYKTSHIASPVTLTNTLISGVIGKLMKLRESAKTSAQKEDIGLLCYQYRNMINEHRGRIFHLAAAAAKF